MSGTTLSRQPQADEQSVRLSSQILDEERAARELARLRWPAGPVCPFCGSSDTYDLHLRTVNRRRSKCRCCRRQFSVTKGTILEGSKLPLASWIRLIQMLCEGEEEPSVSGVSNALNVSYRTAQNAFDRLVYAAKREPLATLLREPEEK